MSIDARADVARLRRQRDKAMAAGDRHRSLRGEDMTQGSVCGREWHARYNLGSPDHTCVKPAGHAFGCACHCGAVVVSPAALSSSGGKA